MKGVGRQFAALFGHLPANQLTDLHVSALLQSWRKTDAQWTQRNKASQLRKLLRHIASTTGAREIKIKLPRAGKQRTRIATDDERTRLWAVASPALKFCLLCWTELGLRFTEPLRIRPEDIDQNTREVCVQVKGGKHITLPVPRKLEELLDGIGPFQDGTPLITQILGKKTRTHDTMRRQWDAARKKAGVGFDLRCHDLRRTLATNLYRITHDTRLVQQALGHENLQTTTSYLAPHDPQHLRAQLESIQWRWKQ
ncbi:MAG: tyrosine-type recombinase/integrase [Candidatus Acidiferrales bacterium]